MKVDSKKIFLVLGESGTGKTTLIKYLAGCKMRPHQVKSSYNTLAHLSCDDSSIDP